MKDEKVSLATIADFVGLKNFKFVLAWFYLSRFQPVMHEGLILHVNRILTPEERKFCKFSVCHTDGEHLEAWFYPNLRKLTFYDDMRGRTLTCHLVESYET